MCPFCISALAVVAAKAVAATGAGAVVTKVVVSKWQKSAESSEAPNFNDRQSALRK